MPIDIELIYNRQEGKKFHRRVKWLFGLITVETTEGDHQQKEPLPPEVNKLLIKQKEERQEKHRKNQNRKQKKKKKGSNLRMALVLLKSKGFVRRVARLIYEIITVAEIKRFNWHLGIGLEDPADTGRLYGVLSPAFAFIYTCPRVHFSFVPRFDRAVLEAELNVECRIVPMKFVLAVLRFIFSEEIIRAAYVAYKSRDYEYEK